MAESKQYDHKRVEEKWQKKWSSDGLYSPDILNNSSTFYNLWMFPYPSAEGLHAGHAFASTGSDVYGRYRRMKGDSVFQPIGYDSFGIHSENFAIKVNETPQNMLKRTTANYARQLKSLGHGYDWTRTVTTSNPEYYKWTQWIFTELFKAGLAYRKSASVNWCPSCKTVLSDEQVIQGDCERCGSTVIEKALEQWFFRITDYAENLLQNLDNIDWTPMVKLAQRNWIGKSEGITIRYKVENSSEEIKCFTSRPDTNYGATFIVLAPEHPSIDTITDPSMKDEVQQYRENSAKKTREERIADGKKKTGVFTGSYAINNLNGEKLPIWISDFVLADVGTGAVVGVPGHDMRDFEFASEFGIPVKRVVVGDDSDKSEIDDPNQVQEKEGTMINSDFLDGMNIHAAKEKIMNYLEEKGWGKRETNYHLRDWLISRQRYWGPPIPMIYCETCAKEGKSWFSENSPELHSDQSDWDHQGWYPDDNLPISLPEIDDYKPKGSGRGPLADHPDFFETKCPQCGAKAKRETDVSDTFLDSAWYFLRYPSVDSKTADKTAWDREITKHWLPVDLYFGGAEHAVLHLMYARFVTHVFHDLGLVQFEEPFPKFFAHGLMIKDGAKMSKSKGNVVNPDEYIEKYGADTMRLYLMFMGPMDGYPDFRDTGIEGMRRFVNRLWGVLSSVQETNVEAPDDLLKKLHQTIKKVTEDIEGYRYNTAIASIMEYVNMLQELQYSGQDAIVPLIQLIAPFAPHMAEEVWIGALGNSKSVHVSGWPQYKEEYLQESVLEIPVQVDGKLRATIQVDSDTASDAEELKKLAAENSKVARWIDSGNVEKVIAIPQKFVNFVTKKK